MRPKKKFVRAALAALKLAAQSREIYGPFNSAHEGFGVLMEEFEELKEHVWTKQRNRDLEAMRKEAIDVAASAIRIAAELCTEKRGRR